MKRFFTLLTTFLLVFVMSFSLVACEKDSTGNSEGGSQSEIIPPDPPALPVLLEREDISLKVTNNFMNITLGEVSGALESEDGIAQISNKIMRDVLVGDIAKLYIGEIISFDYYNDGNWYLSNGVKFTTVPNAIFNYQICSGKPLDISEGQLALYGNNTVISCFTDLFAVNASTLIPQMPGDLGVIVNKLTSITVNELYALSTGDLTFVYEFLSETSIDTLIGAYADIAVYFGGVDQKIATAVSGLVKYLMAGSIAMPEIDGEVEIEVLISNVQYIFSFFFEFDEVNQTAMNELANLFEDVYLYDLEYAIDEIEIDKLLGAITNVIIAENPENGEALLAVRDMLRLFVEGELGYTEIDEEITTRDFLNALYNLASSMGASDEVLIEIAGLSYGRGDELLIESTLEVSEIIELIATAFEFSPEMAELLTEFVSGTFQNAEINYQLTITSVITALKSMVEEGGFASALLTEIDGLMQGAVIGDAMQSVMSIAIDDLINAMANALTSSNPDLMPEMVEEFANLFNLVFSGTVENLGINANLNVADLLGALESALETVLENDMMSTVLDELMNLYGDTSVMNVVEFTMCLAIDDVICSFANIMETAAGYSEMLDPYVNLAFMLLDGTIGSPMLDLSANTADVLVMIEEVVNALNGYEDMELKAIIDDLIAMYGDASFAEFINQIAYEMENYFEQSAHLTIGELLGYQAPIM